MTATLIVVLLAVSVIAGGIYFAITNELNRITEGTIIDKQISEGYTSANFSKENGGSYHSYPTEYFFLIEGEKNGETVKYWTNVTAEEYDNFKVGEYYRK